jgi:hypothetical protein
MAKDPKWAVMVFMGAERVPGDADLLEAALDDLDEMSTLFPRPSDRLNLFAQINSGGEAQRYDVGRARKTAVVEGERDATDGNALLAFIRWALRISGDQDDVYTMLVLWGHAYQFAIGRAAGPTGIEALDFGELADVLARLQKERGKPLSILGFDACDLASIEIAFQFQPYVDYLLASEIGIPIPGWPYDRILERVVDPKGRPMGPAELGSYVVRRYCEAYRADQLTVALTLLRLARAQETVEFTERLARRLATAMVNDSDEFDIVYDSFARSQTIEGKPFVDAAELCVNLLRQSRDSGIRDAAEKLGDLLISPDPVVPNESPNGLGRPFILEHGRNACRTAKLQGVSLYAPHVAPAFDFESADTFYSKLAFTKKTLWNDVVHGLANATS